MAEIEIVIMSCQYLHKYFVTKDKIEAYVSS